MRYLSMYHSELSATSSDAKSISANYIEHPLFSFVDALCCALHYVFIKYVPGLSYSKGYELRSAIKIFLTFRQNHNNKLHPALHLKAVEDIGVEQFRLFVDHLRLSGQSVSPAIRIRSALLKVANENDDGLPLLTLPGVRQESVKPRTPLTESADAAFYASMYSEVDALQCKLDFRHQVDSAEPYSLADVRKLLPSLLCAKPSTDIGWTIDPIRAMKTLLEDGYPFHIYAEDMLELRKKMQLSTWVRDLTKPCDFVLSCCLPYSYSTLRKQTPGSISYLDMISMYYPTAHDQATLAIFIQRQSGWNKESVIAIDKNNFLHPLSEVAHSNVVMLVSEKRKSQSANKNFDSPKLVWAMSNRSDKYSSFNLINLAKELSKPLAGIIEGSDRISLDDVKRNTVFLCLNENPLLWEIRLGGADVRVRSLHYTGCWNRGVASFFKKHQLIDDGVPLISAIDIEGRLRVTWEYYDAKRNKYPLSLTALQLGHGSIETTSVHYDSSPMAMKDRKIRFRRIQEELLQKFRDNKFHGILGSVDRSRSQNPTFRIFTIVGHKRALWACIDSSKPDYPGATPLGCGERCTRLDKCLFCSRIYVLGDSLPFIMERLSTLQRVVEIDEDRLNEHQDEIDILEFILRKWGDESAIFSALVYLRSFEALLPFDMRSLIAYVED